MPPITLFRYLETAARSSPLEGIPFSGFLLPGELGSALRKVKFSCVIPLLLQGAY